VNPFFIGTENFTNSKKNYNIKKRAFENSGIKEIDKNMWEFLSLNPECFGLDISESSLKIAKLKKKERKSIKNLVSFGEMKLPLGIIEKGEIKNEDKLAQIIKEAISKVKGERLKTKYVVASLPEERAFLQVIQLPLLEEEELKVAVKYEAEHYIPLSLEEVYLDYEIIPPLYGKLNHLDVLISALPKEIVDSYVSTLEKADLIPKALEIESQAIARALIKNGVSPFPVLLIDLGASRTRFIIFSGYSLRFTTSISLSSQTFTKAISESLKIDEGEAEKLKIKYGVSGIKRVRLKKGEDVFFQREIIEEKKIFEILTPLLNELAEEIKKYINYYVTHSSHEHLPSNEKNIKKIILSGGGALLKGIEKFLFSKLKIPVELGNPWTNILSFPLKEIPKISFEESLRYTCAFGLALRESEKL